VDDFSVLDLTEPSPWRTQLLIKAMDSFHSFADWKAKSKMVQENYKSERQIMIDCEQRERICRQS
jgi:hypothetical protein